MKANRESLFRSEFALVATLLVALGCGNLEAPIPRFVEVDSVAFEQGQRPGGSSHQITEVWAYADSQFIGAYHVPARFAIPDLESRTLELFAGVRQNGLGSDLAIYPFYTRTTHPLPLEGDVQLAPVFAYDRKIILAAVEDFELGNALRIDIDGDDQTSFRRTTTDALEGSSVIAEVSETSTLLEVESAFFVDFIPSDGRPLYLELDYRSETDIQVGFRLANEVRYLVQLFASDTWTKLYLDLTEVLRGGRSSDFQVRLRAQFDDSNGEVKQAIWLDNIKLVHFGS